MKALPNSFHLNGHTLEFHLQAQKVQPHSLTKGLTLGVNARLTVKKHGHFYCLINLQSSHFTFDFHTRLLISA